MPEDNKIGENTNSPIGRGRPKGAVNKTTALLKDAILMAAEGAGGKEGMVGYLQKQANESPASFLALLGKVLPTQIAGDPENPMIIEIRMGGDDPRNS